MVAVDDIGGTIAVGADETRLVVETVDCRSSTSPCTLAIIDNLPSNPAITVAELDVLERYFSDLLDEVLAPAKL